MLNFLRFEHTMKMNIKNIEDVDRVIDTISSWIISDSSLIERLMTCRDSAIRWMTLELRIFESMAGKEIPIDGFDLASWEDMTYRIRDSVFYKLHIGNYGLNFGFCNFFVPAWRNVAEYFLSDCKTDPEKNWNKCRYGNQEYNTTCVGTDIYGCKLLGGIAPKQDKEYQQLFAMVQAARKRIVRGGMN